MKMDDSRWHFQTLKSAQNAMNQESTTIELPSLKLIFSHLKMDGWNTRFLLGFWAYFQGILYVSFRELYPTKTLWFYLGSRVNLRLVLRRPSQKFPSCFPKPKFWASLLRKRQPKREFWEWQPPGILTSHLLGEEQKYSIFPILRGYVRFCYVCWRVIFVVRLVDPGSPSCQAMEVAACRSWVQLACMSKRDEFPVPEVHGIELHCKYIMGHGMAGWGFIHVFLPYSL